VAPPFRIAEFDVIFGRGISSLGCIVDLAEQNNIIVRKGAWYSYNGENISQGRDNAIKLLEEKPELAQEIETKVKQKLEIGRAIDPAESNGAESNGKASKNLDDMPDED
jgi:recombination protein RecA